MKLSLTINQLSNNLEEIIENATNVGFSFINIIEDNDKSKKISLNLDKHKIKFHACFADFNDFSLERLKKSHIFMNQFGCKLLVIEGNYSQQDLIKISEYASTHNIRIAYLPQNFEDLEFHYHTILDINNPCLGLAVQSDKILNDGTKPALLRHIDGKHIFFMNLAYSFCHKSSVALMIGEGNLPLDAFVRILIKNGYRGIFSHSFIEHSNLNNIYQSLIGLLDISNALPDDKKLPPKTKITAIEFIEFASQDDDVCLLEKILLSLSFRLERKHKTKNVSLWRQGAVNILVNQEKKSFSSKVYDTHGTSICDIGLRVSDSSLMIQRAKTLGNIVFHQAISSRECNIPAIYGVGDSVYHFIDEKSYLHHLWDIDFVSVESSIVKQPAGLRHIDHISQTMHQNDMRNWFVYYLTNFNMTKSPKINIDDPKGSVQSQALQSPEGKFRINLNGTTRDDTVAGNFYQHQQGTGTQHIAFSCDDIFETAKRLNNENFESLKPCNNYYDIIQDLYECSDDFIQSIKKYNIFYEKKRNQEYFQIYSKQIFGGFFFEIIERRAGYNGYGSSNASYRIESQQKEFLIQ